MGSGHLCLPMNKRKTVTTAAGLTDAFAIGFVFHVFFGGQGVFKHCISLHLLFLLTLLNNLYFLIQINQSIKENFKLLFFTDFIEVFTL